MTDQDEPPGGITRREALAGLATASALGIVPPSAAASEREHRFEPATARLLTQDRYQYQYVAKVVCGVAEGRAVAPGEYWTAINVHNPTSEPTRIREKVAIATPGEPGPYSEFSDHSLEPDEAIEFDCPQMREMAPNGDFLKGFFVIQSTGELDVAGVYTVADESGQVQSIDVERVSPQRIGSEGRPDLVPGRARCILEGPHAVVVTVTNQGTAPAGPSKTVVDFGRHGAEERETPPLDPGQSITLTFAIPLGCFDPDCEFVVTVDADDVVDESDEQNNRTRGICLG